MSRERRTDLATRDWVDRQTKEPGVSTSRAVAGLLGWRQSTGGRQREAEHASP